MEAQLFSKSVLRLLILVKFVTQIRNDLTKTVKHSTSQISCSFKLEKLNNEVFLVLATLFLQEFTFTLFAVIADVEQNNCLNYRS